MSVPMVPPVAKKALVNLGLQMAAGIHYQLPPGKLVEQTLLLGRGALDDSGTLVVNSLELATSSPCERFIVEDGLSGNKINRDEASVPFEEGHFDLMYSRIMAWLEKKEMWVRDCYSCEDPGCRVNIRVVTEDPWSNLFVYNSFPGPLEKDVAEFSPDWHIIQVPGFKADPLTDGTRQPCFTIISFSRKAILIGGTGNPGEIQQAIFTMMNYLFPQNREVLRLKRPFTKPGPGGTAISFS